MNRFEYRVFDRHLGHFDQILRRLGGEPQIRESRETYLLSDDSLDQNIKLRYGQLDIKTLEQERDGFEQWAPAGKWSFPLDADCLDQLSQALKLDGGLDEAAGHSESSLLAILAKEGPSLRLVDLFKRRFGYQIEHAGADVAAEWAEVEINGAGIQTVCLESTDLDAVHSLANDIGLLAYPNCNYLRALARVTGLKPMAARPE
ncbi:MAG: hypothetical protein ACXIUB_00240 [Wenzhouxiangella sp.]